MCTRPIWAMADLYRPHSMSSFISGAELVGKLKPVGKEVAAFDKLFEMKVRYFENTAQFVQKLKLTGGEYKVEGFFGIWRM